MFKFILIFLTYSLIKSCDIWEGITPGLTCYFLAMNRGISVENIISMNPGVNCDNLQLG